MVENWNCSILTEIDLEPFDVENENAAGNIQKAFSGPMCIVLDAKDILSKPKEATSLT